MVAEQTKPTPGTTPDAATPDAAPPDTATIDRDLLILQCDVLRDVAAGASLDTIAHLICSRAEAILPSIA